MARRHRNSYRIWFSIGTAIVGVATVGVLSSLSVTRELQGEDNEQRSALECLDRLHAVMRDLQSAQLRALVRVNGDSYKEFQAALGEANHTVEQLRESSPLLDATGVNSSEVLKSAHESLDWFSRTPPPSPLSAADRLRQAEMPRGPVEQFFRISLKAHQAYEASLFRVAQSTRRAAISMDVLLVIALSSATILFWGGYRGIASEAERRLRAERNTTEMARRLLERTRLLNLAPAMVTDFDTGEILSWTDGAGRLFGWTKEEAEGRDLDELLHTESVHSPDSIRQSLSLSGEWSGEVTRYSREGRKLELMLNRVLQTEAGRPALVLEFAADITERKHMETQLRFREERWQLAMSASMDGLWDRDLVENRVYYSKRWKQMIGFGTNELPNTEEAWEARLHPDDRDRVHALVADHLAGKTDRYFAEYRIRCKDGSYKWILARGRALRDESGNPLRLVGTLTDISLQKARDLELAYKASHDPLTRLRTRDSFEQYYEAMVPLLAEEEASLALLMCDLDRFKQINDTHGHQTGDLILAAFADTLKNYTRSGDLACRFGGDEFVALILRLEPGEAIQIAERIRASFANMTFHSATGGAFRVTVTIGVASHRAPIELASLLALADEALYEAKRGGRDSIHDALAPRGEDTVAA